MKFTFSLPSKFCVVALVVVFVSFGNAAFAQSGSTMQEEKVASFHVGGSVEHPMSFSAADLKTMPRSKVKVYNAHEQKSEEYEGVALLEILKRVGAPLGEKLRGPVLATYVIAEASDNYRVIFSLAELDQGFQDSEVLIADTLNGAPLAEKQGPFKLVAPHDKRPARWIRMLQSIEVVTVPSKHSS